MRYQLFFPRGQDMVRYWTHDDIREVIKNVSYEKVYEDAAPADADVEFLWQRHNEGDNMDGNRPLATTHRSMCVGDIIVNLDTRLGYVADSTGFKPLSENDLRDLKLLS